MRSPFPASTASLPFPRTDTTQPASPARGRHSRPWQLVSDSLMIFCGLVAVVIAIATLAWAIGASPHPGADPRFFLGCMIAALALVALRLAILAATQEATLKTLGQEAQSLRDLYQNISEGVFRSTLDGRMISANLSLVRLNGYRTEEQLLTAVNDIAGEWYVNPGRRDEIHAMLLQHGKVEGAVSEIYRHNTRERIWIEENTRLVRDKESGEPLYYDGTVREVTETIRRLDLQDHYDKIGSIVSGCLYQYRLRPDGSASVPYASVGLVHMVGIEPATIAEDASALLDRIHCDDRAAMADAVRTSSHSLSPLQHEFRVVLADGTLKWLSVHAVPEREAEGSTLWNGFLTDVSERKRSEAIIHQLAYYDPLTQLPNRTLLREKLDQAVSPEWKSESHHGLFFIDLDHFKILNDSKGHHAGDLLLCETARRLRRSVRANDIVARLGGDEFVVLVRDLSCEPETAAAQAKAIGEKVLAAVRRPLCIDGSPFQTSASLGATVFRDGFGDADEHLQHADLAMYEAKAAGRGMLRFFAPSMQQGVEHRLSLTSDLRQALAADGLALFFQPQVDSSGRWFGAEALLRWNHPTQGPIPPAQILPLADRNGLINPLEEWVLWEACRTLRSWRADPAMRDLKLSVNLSARQLNRPDFDQRLEHILTTTGADPHLLTVELTESIRLDDIERVGTTIKSLKRLGVSLALDSFGAGYSSLAYLRRLPIDTLKIDGSFTRDIDLGESDRSIVEAILRMASSQSVSAIAEGVETATQHEILTQLGCTAFQGYLFGRPMPVQEFAKKIREGTRWDAMGHRKRPRLALV